MNDPQVVALIYTVEPVKAGRYDKAGLLRFSDSPEFDLTVEDKIARFEFKKFYAYADEALEAIEPFIRHWEFLASMRVGSDSFRLRYKEAEIVDRNPSPPEPRKKGFGGSAVLPGLTASAGDLFVGGSAVLPGLTASAGVLFVNPHYPPPPAGGSVDLDDPVVVKMKSKYEQYCLGRTTLPDAANFYLTGLKEKYGPLSEAAKQCGISKKVLVKISELSAKKGGKDSRKAEGFDDEFTRQEKRFLNRALKEIIIRVAQVAADDSQRHPQITMADLPTL